MNRQMVLGLVLAVMALPYAEAREGWENRLNEPPPTAEQKHWFATLMQPDFPNVSCCGEADAFEADSFDKNSGGEYVAVLTRDYNSCTYDEESEQQYCGGKKRGDRIPIPNNKIKFDQGNPTNHGWVFINSSGTVLCYVTPGGG